MVAGDELRHNFINDHKQEMNFVGEMANDS